MHNQDLRLENDVDGQYEFWSPTPFVSLVENISADEYNEIMYRIKRIILGLILFFIIVMTCIAYKTLFDCKEDIESMNMHLQSIEQSIGSMKNDIESINESIDELDSRISELDSRISYLEEYCHDISIDKNTNN